MLQALNLPDWLPWWVPLALLVPALLWALSFLFMPFSVFGVKSRLEVIEARLDEIQNEIRHVALRLPAGGEFGAIPMRSWPRTIPSGWRPAQEISLSHCFLGGNEGLTFLASLRENDYEDARRRKLAWTF